jgi:thioredoxin reductase
VKNIVLSDGSARSVKAIYSRPDFEQHCTVPRELGCEIAEGGLLVVEPTQRTTVDGVYACGDNSTPARSVALAVSSGMVAGAALNKELVEEAF